MRQHHKLLVWQESIRLVKQVYEISSHYPKEELYGIAAQMRRAAVSIPSNIAEGAARDSSTEFARFLIIARGSLSELETQIIIAQELGYYHDNTVLGQIEKVFALIGGLIRKIRS
ncbi:MAG: four helix bundle protein [Syntrophomonadaceae bacterium]|nr:four helix bundle protein [Syntrophomonadaceae bacterium]